MRSYRRVTKEDRYQLDALLAAGLCRSVIAEILGFHKSTISREIRRNFYGWQYSPSKAHLLAQQRYRACRRPSKLSDSLRVLIQEKLAKGWSPEQIAGRLRHERICRVSHESIYRWIYAYPDLGEHHLRRYMRRGSGRWRQRKAKNNQFLSLRERPLAVQRRKRLGDWERDGMYIACRQQLLILVERKSRYTKIKSIGTAPPKLITKKTIEAISEVPVPAHTMTNDRGPEFKDSPNLEIPTYFCDIQKPQQKGTVENTIGLLRQYIKRTTTAQSLPEEKLNHIETQLNLRPRKVLDYKTPYEVLFQTKVALAH